MDKWLIASKQGDVATLHGLMADDVIFMTPGREPFGKEAFTASNQRPMPKEATSNIQEIKVLGNSAWMRNHLDLVVSFPQRRVQKPFRLHTYNPGKESGWSMGDQP